MAKKEKISEQEVPKVLDKTNQKWYNKPESNKVTFCNSIDDIINGAGETFEFTEKFLSSKSLGGGASQKNLYLFILNDGRFIVARKRDGLK